MLLLQCVRAPAPGPQTMLPLQCGANSATCSSPSDRGLQILGDGGTFRIEALGVGQGTGANFESPRIMGQDGPQRSIFFQGGQEKLLSRVTSVELIKGAGSAGAVSRARHSDISRPCAHQGGQPLGDRLSDRLGLARFGRVWQGLAGLSMPQAGVMAARWHSAGWNLWKSSLEEAGKGLSERSDGGGAMWRSLSRPPPGAPLLHR
jgi:hypothetical protein